MPAKNGIAGIGAKQDGRANTAVFRKVGSLIPYGEKSLRMKLEGDDTIYSLSRERVIDVINGAQNYTGITKQNEENCWVITGYLALTKSGNGVLIKVGDRYFVSSRTGVVGILNGKQMSTSVSEAVTLSDGE